METRTKREMIFDASLYFLYAFTMLYMFGCCQPSYASTYNNIGDALFGKGYRKTVCVGAATATHGRQPLYGTFDPSKPDIPGRYGFDYAKVCAGNYVGERMSPDIVLGVVNHPTNPLNMTDNMNYHSTNGGACGSHFCIGQQDQLDVVLIADQAGTNVYDSYFTPAFNQLFPATPSPTVAPTATPTARPSPSPTATPVPPTPTPAPGTSCAVLSQKDKDTASLMASWKTIGVARQARLQSLAAWIRGCK